DLVGVTPGPEPESTTLGLWQEPNQENQDQPEIAYLPFKGYQVEANKLEKSRLHNQNPSNDHTRFHGIRNSILNHILTDFLIQKKRDGVNKEGFPIHYPLEDWDRTGNVVQPKPERGVDEIQRLLYRALQGLDPEDALAVADKIEFVGNSMVQKYGPYPQIASPDKPRNIFGTFNHPIQGTWESQVNITDFHIKAVNLTLYLCAPSDAKFPNNPPWQDFRFVMGYFIRQNIRSLRLCNEESTPLTLDDVKAYVRFKGEIEHVDPHFGPLR
ncbi:hypothetical protein TCAL_12814, partial [Tigriopus californicus]